MECYKIINDFYIINILILILKIMRWLVKYLLKILKKNVIVVRKFYISK